jgi:hypothetical protein
MQSALEKFLLRRWGCIQELEWRIHKHIMAEALASSDDPVLKSILAQCQAGTQNIAKQHNGAGVHREPD